MNGATVVTRYVGDERRAGARDRSTHPVKVYHETADKYYAGRTSNTSPYGALLVVQRSMPIASGDQLSVAIARTSQDVVMGHDEMIASEVVRVTPIDPFTQAVAVRFAESVVNADYAPEVGLAPQAA